MWWIIIVVIVIMVIKFANDSNKQANAVAKQGGMRVKYRKLINHLLNGDANCKIIQETKAFISVGVSGISGSTVFFIQQTFGTVTIQYKVKSKVFGNHQLEWRFDEFADQDKMIEKILNDVNAYNNNMMQKFM